MPREVSKMVCTYTYKPGAFYDILCVLCVCEVPKLLIFREVGRYDPHELPPLNDCK